MIRLCSLPFYLVWRKSPKFRPCCTTILTATAVNDPLLQTLMEQDRILSRSKLPPSSSKTQEKTRCTPSEYSSETSDNQSEGFVNTGKAPEGGNSSSSGESGAPSLPADIQPLDEKAIIQNRLSLEQIKEIPKFMSYHPGEPNKV